jgi:hypothetical protein
MTWPSHGLKRIPGGPIETGRLVVAWSRLALQDDKASNRFAEMITPLRDCRARSVNRRSVALAAIDPFFHYRRYPISNRY